MTVPDNDARITDFLIDQIVDGVLTPSQLRGAVEQLDRDPDGWKRCALAFLEAQVWTESFRALGESTQVLGRGNAVPIHPPRVSPATSGRRWLRMGVAAGIIAASFTAGWFAHRRPDLRTQAPVVVQSPPVESVPFAVDDSRPEPSPPDDGLISDTGELAVSPSQADLDSPAPVPTIRTVGHVRVGSGPAQADVPILSGPGITDAWLRGQPPPVSERGQVMLERRGYQVEQHRRLLTTILADGRRVTIPVDEVKIQYTGIDSL